MSVRLLADAVVVVHFGFIIFVAVGPLLAWRWRHLVWLHGPALGWAALTVAVGVPCPLTLLEKGCGDRLVSRGTTGASSTPTSRTSSIPVGTRPIFGPWPSGSSLSATPGSGVVLTSGPRRFAALIRPRRVGDPGPDGP